MELWYRVPCERKSTEREERLFSLSLQNGDVLVSVVVVCVREKREFYIFHDFQNPPPLNTHTHTSLLSLSHCLSITYILKTIYLFSSAVEKIMGSDPGTCVVPNSYYYWGKGHTHPLFFVLLSLSHPTQRVPLWLPPGLLFFLVVVVVVVICWGGLDTHTPSSLLSTHTKQTHTHNHLHTYIHIQTPPPPPTQKQPWWK